MSEPSELTTIYRFRIGEAYDDLAPVFAIDGRDYTAASAVRADVRDASAALELLHLIGDFETSQAGPQTPKPDLPSWPQWRERHVVGGEPTGVRPASVPWTAPAGWTEMGQWLDKSHAWLRDQLAGAADSVPGGRTVVVSDQGPARIGRASAVPADERYRVDAAFLLVPPPGHAVPAALDVVSGWLRRAGWDVAEPVVKPRVTTVSATNAGHVVTAVWQHDEASILLSGESPTVDSTIFAGPAQ